nr:Na+/H+ antiporter NhaA [Roseomonas harenae]
MSLFITLLAFPGDVLLQAEAKIGILGGSLLPGLLGYALLRVARSDIPGNAVTIGLTSFERGLMQSAAAA